MKKIILIITTILTLLCPNNLYAITNSSSKDNEYISSKVANTITYNLEFCNYQLTPAEYVMSNGGISIFIKSTTSAPGETISFELVHNNSRTGKIKTVPLQANQYVSWGELPAGNYKIRVTSSKASYYENIYVYATIRVIYGD